MPTVISSDSEESLYLNRFFTPLRSNQDDKQTIQQFNNSTIQQFKKKWQY